MDNRLKLCAISMLGRCVDSSPCSPVRTEMVFEGAAGYPSVRWKLIVLQEAKLEDWLMLVVPALTCSLY